MKADNTQKEDKASAQSKKIKPIYYGASGCALGFIIMVIFVVFVTLVGISMPAFGTILNVGSWVVPIGFGILGYLYGKSKQ